MILHGKEEKGARRNENWCSRRTVDFFAKNSSRCSWSLVKFFAQTLIPKVCVKTDLKVFPLILTSYAIILTDVNCYLPEISPFRYFDPILTLLDMQISCQTQLPSASPLKLNTCFSKFEENVMWLFVHDIYQPFPWRVGQRVSFKHSCALSRLVKTACSSDICL
jgi:hypothetical protein